MRFIELKSSHFTVRVIDPIMKAVLLIHRTLRLHTLRRQYLKERLLLMMFLLQEGVYGLPVRL